MNSEDSNCHFHLTLNCHFLSPGLINLCKGVLGGHINGGAYTVYPRGFITGIEKVL